MRTEGPNLPQGGIPGLAGWSISKHAWIRACKRRVLPEEIVAAIHRPTKVTPTRGNFATTERRERAGVAVVVDRVRRHIITVVAVRPSLADRF
jgi:hypothetical protein